MFLQHLPRNLHIQTGIAYGSTELMELIGASGFRTRQRFPELRCVIPFEAGQFGFEAMAQPAVQRLTVPLLAVRKNATR